MVPSHSFERVDVTAWQVDSVEASGADAKDWLREPARARNWLFKPRVEHGDWAQGEDWAEKVSSEVGTLMGIPAARVELAVRGGVLGSISLDLKPRGWELQPGSVLLSGRFPDYQHGALRVAGRPGHSLTNIRNALAGYAAPPGMPDAADLDAFDCFAGYLTFDAMVANRDRHDDNWAVLRAVETGSDRLAGTYDHGSTLGYNLQNSRRELHLGRGSVPAWCSRGTAWRFEHDPNQGPATLIELAGAALRMVRPEVRTRWLDSVSATSASAFETIIGRIPELSEAEGTFALEVLTTNRGRLLDEC